MFVPWSNGITSGLTTKRTYAIPGVCALDWYPTVGYSKSATDPASVVGKEIFAKVREKFSGSIDADAPDFVIYLMALDSVYSYVAALKRVYRILTAYTSENHYIPDALLQAMHFTPTQIVDMKEHRMQLFQIINELVLMTRKFNVPAAFDIMNRHYWLNDNVYMDAESINSQFYVFNCLGYYMYELKEISSGVKAGGLTMTTMTIPNTNVVEYLFSFGRSLIDALAGSDDAYIISGYLMRAYEGMPAFIVDEMGMDEKLVPHYDPEVLMQIENAYPIMASGNQLSLSNDVTQDPSTNAVVCEPSVTTNYTSESKSYFIPDLFLSIRSDNPTVADVTIATRLKMGVDNVKMNANIPASFDIVCGSEILRSISIWVYWNDGSNVSLRQLKLQSVNVCDGTTVTSNIISAMTALQSFDWHPILSLVNIYNSAQTGGEIMIMGDVHNTTLLTAEMLKQLNRVCLYSEFNSYGQL